MKHPLEKLRTKIDTARDQGLGDDALRTRIRELVYASMAGMRVQGRYLKTDFVMKWAKTTDDIIEMINDLADM